MDLLRWARYYFDRLAAGILAALGLLALLLGYLGVSGTVYPAEQLPYMISGGILGLFFLGAAGTLYLSADMRDEWRKLDRIDESLHELVGQTTRELDEASTPVDASDVESPAPTTEPVDVRPDSKAAERGNGSRPRAAARQGTTRRSSGRTSGARS